MTLPISLARRLRFHQLELVVALVQSGNLGVAAQQLHVTRAALSKSLRELESALGIQLFDRSSAGMTPTAAGLKMARHARLLLGELDSLRRDMADTSPAQTPLLRLGMPPFIAAHVAPDVLARLRAAAPPPGPLVQVHEGRLHALIELLLRGDIDAVLALYAPQAVAGLDLGMLSLQACGEVQMVVVAARGLRLPGRSPYDWEALGTLPWILPHTGTHLRTSVDQMFKAGGQAAPVPTIESNSLEANVQFAVAGLGLAVVPAQAAEAEIAAGRLRIVRTRQPLPATQLVLMVRKVATLYVDVLDRLAEALRSSR
ncbi:MAG: LysR family transcriptional regulator [Pseudacidovorax sp.]|nr:LysR family transcriptional regulator [Pseudacidovorax sp.]